MQISVLVQADWCRSVPPLAPAFTCRSCCRRPTDQRLPMAEGTVCYMIRATSPCLVATGGTTVELRRSKSDHVELSDWAYDRACLH